MGHIKHKRRKNNLGLLALEPRWLFDGAAVVDAAHAAPDAGAKALIPVVAAPVQIRAADPAQDGGRKEVVFVVTSLSNYQALEAAVKPGVEIEEIGGGQGGLAQMAKWAETHSGYDSISILSHGAEGAVRIGTDTVTDAQLSDATVKAELAQIGHALKAGGDLLLYGCDVAEGVEGQSLINDLAAATGADVAASTHVIGQDGDWTLDAATGTITATRFSAPDYSGDLVFEYKFTEGTVAAGTNLLDSYTGTLFTFSSAQVVDLPVGYTFGYIHPATHLFVAYGNGEAIHNGDQLALKTTTTCYNGYHEFTIHVDSANSGNGQAFDITYTLTMTGGFTPSGLCL